jgi:Family of unknown function (DUF6516)
LTSLSAVDKYNEAALERLLDLDGEIMELGKGYWAKIQAARVPATPSKPHGIDYALCLFAPDGRRLVCIDNSHAVSVGRPPARKMSTTNDHKHVRNTVLPHEYADPETLMEDFWTEVDRVLKEEGVP